MSLTMRYLYMPVIAGAAMFAAGCQQAQNEDTAKILAEFKEVRIKLDKIEAELKKASAPESLKERPGDEWKKINFEALRKIELPANPTSNEIKEYLQKIQLATKGQNCFSPDDPQVEMIVKLGEKNLVFLIDAMQPRNQGMPGSYHITQAISAMPLGNESKALLIKGLRKNPELISKIVNNGWEKDARDTIKEILLNPRNNGRFASKDLFLAAISLQDPEINTALRNFFINGSNRAITYQVTKNVAAVNIDDDAVAQAWNQAIMASGEFERLNMAGIAVGYGHKNALEVLLDRNQKNHFGPDFNYTLDNAIRNTVDCSGSVADIKKWYETNKNNLVFDKADKKFKVKKADAQITPPATKQ